MTERYTAVNAAHEMGRKMEIKFKRVEFEDKTIINHYLKPIQGKSCEMTFSNIYLWERYYKMGFAVVENTLVFQSTSPRMSFTFPASIKDVKPAIDKLMEFCAEKGEKFRMHLVTAVQFELLEKLYPGKFKIEYVRDDADYVYETEKLIALSGKKYHSKKNHVNRFKAVNEWCYESITESNLEECFQMGLQWREDNEVEKEEEKRQEIGVTLNALRLFKELELKGGLIRVNGKIVAFTIGEPLDNDTFVVHIEKAFSNINGAYTIINQEFAADAAKNFKYINREEDVGAEGLRKAKLSYHPVFMLEKGIVTMR